MTVRVEPITDADVDRVARFLHAQLNDRVTPDAWARAMRVPWQVDAPNHGYLLRDDDGDRVVGAYLAFYSERAHRRARRSASATSAPGACCPTTASTACGC